MRSVIFAFQLKKARRKKCERQVVILRGTVHKNDELPALIMNIFINILVLLVGFFLIL